MMKLPLPTTAKTAGYNWAPAAIGGGGGALLGALITATTKGRKRPGDWLANILGGGLVGGGLGAGYERLTQPWPAEASVDGVKVPDAKPAGNPNADPGTVPGTAPVKSTFFGGVEPYPLTARAKSETDASMRRQAGLEAAGYGVAGLLAGGGLASAAALTKRLSEPGQAEELTDIRSRTGPIMAIGPARRKKKKKALPAPSEPETPATPAEGAEPEAKTATYNSTGDVEWSGPATAVGLGGGTLLGYLLLRHMWNKQNKDELTSEKNKAEASFTKSISRALKPVGLSLTPSTGTKLASVHAQELQDMSDEDACMCYVEAAVEKHADSSLPKSIGWWGALAAGLPLAVGGIAGWGLSASRNKFRKELSDIKKRQILTAINSPMSPVVTVKGKVPDNWDDTPDEDEDESDVVDEGSADAGAPSPEDKSNIRRPLHELRLI